MAIELEDKTNVTAPNADYPYGDIKDNDGSSNGTPVNRNTYADFHQFFARILALSGVVANGLLENATNGFQYVDALIANIRSTTASETENGTVERATESETNTGTDSTRYVTPLRLKGYVDDPTRLPSSSTTSKGVAEIATQAEVDNGTDSTRYVTPLTLDGANTVMGVDGSIKLRTKVINIGDWDMSATSFVNVAHGLDISKIRECSIMVRNDNSSNFISSNYVGVSNNDGVILPTIGYRITSTSVSIERDDILNNISYDQTSFNRGWITIRYEV